MEKEGFFAQNWARQNEWQGIGHDTINNKNTNIEAATSIALTRTNSWNDGSKTGSVSNQLFTVQVKQLLIL